MRAVVPSRGGLMLSQIGLMASLMLLIGCSSLTAPVGSTPTSNAPSATVAPAALALMVANDTSKQDSPLATWDIAYVQVTGVADSSVAQTINTGLKSPAEKHKTDLLTFIAQDPPPTDICGSDVTCKTSTVTLKVVGDLLTPTMVSAGYNGYSNIAKSAHGLNLDDALNFNLKTGHSLTNRDLVNPGASSAEQAQHYQDLVALVRQLVQATLDPAICTIDDQNKLIGGIDDPSLLFFTSQGAMIGYPNYSFGPNPCGFDPKLIPYSQLKGMLNPTYFPDLGIAGS